MFQSCLYILFLLWLFPLATDSPIKIELINRKKIGARDSWYCPVFIQNAVENIIFLTSCLISVWPVYIFPRAPLSLLQQIHSWVFLCCFFQDLWLQPLLTHSLDTCFLPFCLSHFDRRIHFIQLQSYFIPVFCSLLKEYRIFYSATHNLLIDGLVICWFLLTSTDCLIISGVTLSAFIPFQSIVLYSWFICTTWWSRKISK